jgi:hypothetical protein
MDRLRGEPLLWPRESWISKRLIITDLTRKVPGDLQAKADEATKLKDHADE